MSEWMKHILESKHAHRVKLAALPIEEKIRLLGVMRNRTQAIRNTKASHT